MQPVDWTGHVTSSSASHLALWAGIYAEGNMVSASSRPSLTSQAQRAPHAVSLGGTHNMHSR